MKKLIREYTVEDLHEKKILVSSGSAEEVRISIGITKSQLYDYTNVKPYKGRYKIDARELSQDKPPRKNFSTAERMTMQEYDAAMLYLVKHYKPEALRKIAISCSQYS